MAVKKELDLYTGYYKEMNLYKEKNLLPVSISRFQPKGYVGEVLTSLAPSEDLLRQYKNLKITMDDYDKEYLSYLESEEGYDAIRVDLGTTMYQKALDGGYDGIVLMCYESPDEFCHRKLLANYLQEHYHITVKEYSDAQKENQVEEVSEPKPIVQRMYGSTHTHFESLYDTANNLEDMLRSFASLGAKRVAVTEHGEFTSFEDLKDIAKDMDIKVIPGIEGYLGEDREHIILIAKNEEGYRQLSHIITASNENHNEKDQPIMTLDMFRKYATGGNIICTTACIAGPFGHIFVDDEKEKERVQERYIKRLSVFTEEEQRTILAKEEEWVSFSDKDRKQMDEETKEDYKENHKKFLTIKRNRDKLQTIEEDFSKQYTLEEKIDMARDIYEDLTDIFGEDNVYLEIQNHGIDKEQEVYSGVVNFARVMGITDKLIAANDIHIGKTKEELSDTDFLKRNVAKFRRFNTYTEYEDWEKELYIKDNDELKETLLELPGIKEEEVDIAIQNVENTLSSCELEYLYGPSLDGTNMPKKEHYPKFCENENKEFDRLLDEGIRLKFPGGFPNEEYKKRLDYEKKIIKEMGYAGYHLIVQDYLDYARHLGYLPKDQIQDAPLDLDELKELTKAYTHDSINIGPGRGSAAGSLCCYLLGISDIDPMPYDLLFERFLNPERISMPDIDSDFRTDIRKKCIEYCANKYGKTGGTCKIMTKSYGKIKGNIRLAARFYGMKDYEAQKQASPLQKYDKNTESDFLKPYYKLADKLSKLVDDNISDIPEEKQNLFTTQEKEIYQTAVALDGLFTGYGQHAAGTIISGDRLEDILPLKWNDKKENYETQCTMAQAEDKGLLKMDFLGLENLDILSELMHQTHDCIITDYSRREELLNNKEVLSDIFSTGLTHGVFQFESDGMKQMLREFRPDSFEDLILLVAAYRPGPLQYLPEIIATKKYQDGRSNIKPVPKINIDNQDLKDILAPTYGCIIYQEQVMKICQKLAGFTMGHADNVRKFMSKKKLEKLEHEREAFINGCFEVSHISKEESNQLFDQMLDFASYAFNKSHATVYALVSFFTAYYKKYYPAKFFACSLNHMHELSELQGFRSELASFKIQLLPPTMGYSRSMFQGNDRRIYFGYSGIKGLSAIDVIPEESIEQVLLSNASLGIKTLEKLAYVGTFDALGNRPYIISYIHQYGEKLLKKQETVERLEALQKADVLDKRKISGANRTLSNIGEIPSFEEYCQTNEVDITDNHIKEESRKLLETVFLTAEETRYLNQFPSFETLEEDAPVTQRGFYLMGVEKKEIYFKNSSRPTHVATIMDGNYHMKKVFLPEVIPPGIYSGPVDGKPFSMNLSVEEFYRKVKPVTLKEREKFMVCPKTILSQQIVVECFRKINNVSENRGNYIEIYSRMPGHTDGSKLGTLSKVGLQKMQEELLDRHIPVEKDYLS